MTQMWWTGFVHPLMVHCIGGGRKALHGTPRIFDQTQEIGVVADADGFPPPID
jgi:hypothetical protein